MFDLSGLGGLSQMVADRRVPPIHRLRAAAQLQRLAEAAQAEVIAELAVVDGWDREDETFRFEEHDAERRLVRVGVDGQPMDEALPLEVACATHSSVGVATELISDIVDLSTRHPGTWEAVGRGKAALWQARRLAQTCGRYEFTRDQAMAIDARVAPLWDTIGYQRFARAVRAAIMRVAPRAAHWRADQAAADRFCQTHPSEDPGTMYVTARVDAGDAVELDSTLARIADRLAERGDERDQDHRRATALGVLASPAVALALLDGRDVADSARPTSRVFVHLHADALTGQHPVARVETIGPILVSQLARIVGHARIKVTPVLHLGADEPAVDAYEIPDRIREHVIQRDRHEVFPYSSRPARRQDLDHTIPYQPGGESQTRPSNLGPLSRRAHRAKTHAGWQLSQPEPGIFYWTTELGQTFTVSPTDTTRPPPGLSP